MIQLEEDLLVMGFCSAEKTAKRNKSIHNFLCYFGIIFSNPFLSFLLPSVSNSMMHLESISKSIP